MSKTNDQRDPETATTKPPTLLKDGGLGGEVPPHGGARVPEETRGRTDLKNDGNPNVTGDVRSEG
ncbi:hypothetical protein [Aureimonas sp. AU22]|uniref:hypothetical protein n=1 Tax=Aureimonas sp. AU22 TaxID=1638162 RepID=UPI000782513B|nr:hypothetical protein [Aureimonas sp. AU22]